MVMELLEDQIGFENMFTELYHKNWTKIEQAVKHNHIRYQEIMINSVTGQK